MEIVFDIEATGSQKNKAHPYDYDNRMCNLGLYDIKNNNKKIWKIEYDEEPYGEFLQEIQSMLDNCTVLIGANLKFDIAWLRRYNLTLPSQVRVYDVQLGFYILTHQKNKYPSLEQIAEFYGIEGKLDIVKTEYWERGLDTDQVPYPILEEYLAQDLEVTKNVYLKMQEHQKRESFKMNRLISVSMQDLVVLQDMEQNGLLLDTRKCLTKGEEIVNEINEIDHWLRQIFNAPWLNVNSGEHLSVVLYGGTIELPDKEEYTFHYKDGRTAQKFRNVKVPKVFKGLFEPLPKTELAKDGFFSTAEPTLVKLRQKAKGEAKVVIDKILHRAKIEKRRSTYYHGYPKTLEKMGWTHDNIIHSSFNQCVAETGRLSSTKPNVQNIEARVNEVFITRYKHAC